jgi:hypothetical protein
LGSLSLFEERSGSGEGGAYENGNDLGFYRRIYICGHVFGRHSDLKRHPLNGLSYPGYTCLRYVSTWVNRNEIWHDYRLSEEAEAAGFKIRAVRGDVAGHLISVRVSP